MLAPLRLKVKIRVTDITFDSTTRLDLTLIRKKDDDVEPI